MSTSKDFFDCLILRIKDCISNGCEPTGIKPDKKEISETSIYNLIK